MTLHTLEEVEELGGYRVLYADPCWSYRNGGRGAASKQYATMPDAALARLPVGRLGAKDSVMFMWGTWPTLPVNLATMAAWDYEYKTLGFLWVKTNEKAGTPFWGGGFWTRSNSEFCLLGVRGDIRRISASVHQLVETWEEQGNLVLRAPVGKHSAKPPEVRDRIVKLMGDVPRIELFARERVPFWDCHGDQIPGGADVHLEESADVRATQIEEIKLRIVK
jgi:site-specific DNA-methyltransferase (adenine-specific)